jgi:alcohol dehydrogenase
MRALAIGRGGRFTWQRCPEPPPPGPDGALVHPIAIATCDLDRALALGRTPFLLPLHFGHECVAEVVSVGERVRGVRPGDRVVVPFQISCGRCAACRAGHTANCLSVPPLAMYGFGLLGGHWGGALSDLLAVPFADGMLVPLPPGVDPAAAASVADNVSDAYRHIAPYLPADDVLVVGAQRSSSLFGSSTALYAALVARALGSRRVRIADGRRALRERAEQLGFEALTPRQLRGAGTAPLVVDVSVSARGAATALTHTAPDGVCSSAGGLHARARLPAALLYARNVTYVVGRSHARTAIPRVLELMADGALRPELVTSTVASLDDAPRALRDHVRGEDRKTVLLA